MSESSDYLLSFFTPLEWRNETIALQETPWPMSPRFLPRAVIAVIATVEMEPNQYFKDVKRAVLLTIAVALCKRIYSIEHRVVAEKIFIEAPV